MQALRSTLDRNQETIYAITRIVVAFLYGCHGAQKLFGVMGGEKVYGNPLMVVAGVIEFGCGLLIALGWQTTLAAFIASGEMAVAYFIAHQPHGFWPIANGGEKAVFYAFVFLFIAARGAGIWSLDAKSARRGG